MMASSSSPEKEVEGDSSTTVLNWLELPRDITTNILQRLSITEIITRACLVCPLWWNICKDPFMWRIINLTILDTSFEDLKNIVDYALERSCGNLEEINIECLCSYGLLKCIANRASNLRRIRLERPSLPKGFCEVVKKLSLLEELSLLEGVDVSLSCLCLESIGRGCPLLKSLKFKKKCCENIKCDEDAFAIANTMPKLRLLMIFGNSLTNVGLLSILDACPLLEDLDLRECLNLDLSGRLGKRCQDQIIYLRLSNYDVDDTCYDHDNSCQRSQSKMYDHSDLTVWISYAELPNTPPGYYDVDDNDNDYYCPRLCDSLEYDFDYLLYLDENENLDGSSHDYA